MADTRQQKGKHENIEKYCKANGIDLKPETLNVGDYMIPGGKISVDTKKDLNELCRNLMNRKDHSRFWREVRRAKEQGIKLYILVEHGGKIKSIKDVALWNDHYSKVSGRALMNEIFRVHISYGVEFLFCSKKDTGRKVVEILTTKH